MTLTANAVGKQLDLEKTNLEKTNLDSAINLKEQTGASCYEKNRIATNPHKIVSVDKRYIVGEP